ncbi:hypothetical protein N7468_005270 [Penicillium chermesinum]|uniref:2EXR domain-containing protein n=1 Tax=Penicillium chermesinum TaxID=63820 RepID=A0A9W9TPI7_9EURO|nr:uncharacterized protein N7468_005270 [Penicillium chermesinum]KAJ5232314.1 hypothetical protein N7468_005270 [Penicillium chermesinum]KAJ6171970.1 hypothetical protein N7470_001037 [Penicillium chermesinum]
MDNMASTSSFLRFPDLPTELRLNIWYQCLPEDSALFFYKEGCWHARNLPNAEEGIPSEMEITFLDERLDPVNFTPHILSVNQEAREVAQSWIHRKALQGRLESPAAPQPPYVRRFDRDVDTLYVPHEKWVSFISEMFDKMFDPDIGTQILRIRTHSYKRIALPLSVLESFDEYPDPIETVVKEFAHFDELVIVINSPPDLPMAQNGSHVQQRWVLQHTPIKLFWKHEEDASASDRHRLPENEPLFSKIKGARNSLSTEPPGREVRFVRAARA